MMQVLAAGALALTMAIPAAAPEQKLTVEVDLSDRHLQVKLNDEIIEEYGVAVGAPEYPTPTGTFTIKNVIWNPGWVPPPDSKWAKGKKPTKPGDPKNPMRAVKIPFLPPYAIHGTDKPHSIGKAVSHGCIRMKPEEAAALARTLMERTGEVREENWFKRILRGRRSAQVALGQEVELVVVD